MEATGVLENTVGVRNNTKSSTITVIAATPGRGVQFLQTEKGIVVYFKKRKDCFLEQT
jgi:hypothetical protein